GFSQQYGIYKVGTKRLSNDQRRFRIERDQSDGTTVACARARNIHRVAGNVADLQHGTDHCQIVAIGVGAGARQFDGAAVIRYVESAGLVSEINRATTLRCRQSDSATDEVDAGTSGADVERILRICRD